MRTIYITLLILLAAMTGMAYLYFSKLSARDTTENTSLNAAIVNSGMVFCIQNDKNVLDLISGQDYFGRIIGPENAKQLALLKTEILSNSTINSLMSGNSIYIGFSPAKKSGNSYLISTKLNKENGKALVLKALKTGGVQTEGTAAEFKLTFRDSTVLYAGIKDELIVLSNEKNNVHMALNAAATKQSDEFLTYIRSGDKISKNSLANLYIDFNRFPKLVKTILPGNLTANFSLFDQQNSFAALNYNFSRERLFFNGNTSINHNGNYLSIYANLPAGKMTIDNLLPSSTASFAVFIIPDYRTWHKGLSEWFRLRKEDAQIKANIANTNQKYHLDIETIFPVYFKNQLISFQLSTAEQMGAIQLSNGDKMNQLLLDISENYNEDIKILQESDLLYAYFGEPFRKFRKPYYTIIDNYMVFSNHAGAVQRFLNSYRKNELLINTPDYAAVFNQIAKDGNVVFYTNLKNAANLINDTRNATAYKYLISAEGAGIFSSAIYQLTADKGRFQTNLLINLKSAESGR